MRWRSRLLPLLMWVFLGSWLWTLANVVAIAVRAYVDPRSSTPEWIYPQLWILCWATVLVPLIGAALRWYEARCTYPPGHCQKCGYNLTGNESGRCPECGTEVPMKQRGGSGW